MPRFLCRTREGADPEKKVRVYFTCHEDDFDKYFEIIKEGSKDNRNFVKKSVNWALRQIGKSSLENNKKALNLAYEILEIDNKASKWVARGAIKELESEKVQDKF